MATLHLLEMNHKKGRYHKIIKRKNGKFLIIRLIFCLILQTKPSFCCVQCFKLIWKVGKVGKEGRVGKVGKEGKEDRLRE
jgi:hypothetical protein